MLEKLDAVSDIYGLEKFVLEFNQRYYPNSNLKPILGGGKKQNPKFMLVFINPTKKNIATDPAWTGQRAPWIGIKPIWKVFYHSDLIDEELFLKIQTKDKSWSVDFVDLVYENIAKQSVYITNIVKWSGEDATLPETQKIDRYFPILLKEIDLIKPEYIISFGQIPLQKLSNEKTTLGEYYQRFLSTGRMSVLEIYSLGHKYNLIPCYFPVGMGRFKEKEAVHILKSVFSTF